MKTQRIVNSLNEMSDGVGVTSFIFNIYKTRFCYPV